ncbi:restriction endonuclease subunit S [Vibrio vulnificus]|uniref:restriction endonuclease subunit S n=1 Tax=Vibrio vulnificus TaxID=672 RepID=UPI001DE3CFAD|nr:hypothetical protein [Vibrio vulnificus]EHH0745927.1 hypothetical protein [Vibrio vulnificus]EHZ2847643.1 restriction endonuclease subunit S [Vibrio vulnificus]
MTEQMNVPKLRFGEFEGYWTNSSMKDISKINQGLQIPISERHTELEEGRYFYITNEFLRPNSTTKYYIENPSDRVICEERDILMTRTGNTGQVVTNIAGVFHNNFFKIDYSNDVDKHFLVEFLRLSTTQSMILRYAGTSTIPDLNHGDFYRIRLALPELPEQQKIASFLSKVDEKIALLTEKKDKLTEYKKGVMQQLFNGKWEEQDGQLIFIPPTLRFKADDGSEFPDWVESRIGDLGHFYYGKSAPKWSVTDEATIPCVRYGELYSKFKGTVDQIYSKTSIPKEKLKFSKGGEVLVPRVGEDPLDFAKCSYLPFSDVAIGEMISVFNTKEDGQFIATYFRATCQKKFARLVEGGNVSNLYFRYLEDVSVCIPSKNEQLKISDFISKVNIKLELLDKELSKAKAWKKGLLQQMFV